MITFKKVDKMELFEKCRKAMVDCQIKPSGVTDENIIDAFSTVPREIFVADDLKSIVYVDEDVPLSDGGGFLMAPSVYAKMLQESNVEANDIALNIGDDSGYSTAILSKLVTTVVVIEQVPGFYDKARQLWSDLGLCNIAIVDGDPDSGGLDHAPYSLILMNGSVATIPESLVAQLTNGGRLCAVLRENETKQGQVVVVERVGEGDRSCRPAFDASTPYLPSYKPEEVFVF